MKYAPRMMIALLLGLLMFALSLPLAQSSYAKSASQNKISHNRAKRDRLWDRVKELSADQSQLTATISILDDRQDTTEGQIKKIRTQLQTETAHCEQLKARGDELQRKLESSQSILSDRARAIYMQGELSYMDLLFQSASFGELIDKLFFVQAIFERDEKLIKGTIINKAQLEEQLVAVEQQINEINKIKQSLQTELTNLEDAKGEKELDMQAIEADKNLALRQIHELEAENKRIAARLRANERSATSYKGRPWAGSFNKPCAGSITSGFGMRFHPILHYNRMHTGVDISAPRGTAIMASGEGQVYFAGTMGGYGKCVIVDHGNSRTTLYGHMSRISCSVGQHVTTKSKLGEVGSTGFSTGNHCHFEVRIHGDPVDPLRSLK